MKIWLLTDRLCSRRNGASTIASRTGNVNRRDVAVLILKLFDTSTDPGPSQLSIVRWSDSMGSNESLADLDVIGWTNGVREEAGRTSGDSELIVSVNKSEASIVLE